MNTMASKADNTPWMPWDLFPELQPLEEEESDEDVEANAQGILQLFKGLAAVQRAADS